ncbi:trypsin-like peptidase domain-containing protein [Brevibacterium renqingii]|uniref:trypsin-like peptidase domain-containing protein n=1 Tax=Brevibacterium renqingii TaxID=2776916 RepID=UPI001AE051D6|nr:trypsin-like peptidase domain-containing protein [Brevibacterium renqingii]
MSENNHPQEPGETSPSRGQHWDQDHRTFPNPDERESPASDRRGSSAGRSRGSSAEVPRTFPNHSAAPRGANGAGGTSAAGANGAGVPGTSGSGAPGASSGGPARVSPPVAPPERRPDAHSSPQTGYSPQDSRPGQAQPTHAQNPVDGHSGERGHPSGQNSDQTNRPPQRSSYPQGGQQPGHQQPWQQQQAQHSDQSRPQAYPGAAQQPPAYPGSAHPGAAQAHSAYAAGGEQPAYAAPGAQPTDAAPGAQPTGTGSYPAAAGAYPQGTGSYPPPAGSQPAGMGSQPGPGGPGAPGGPGVYGPFGPEQPPRREKKGPGWGATIAIALIAALLGGGAAFGGNYALSALQGDEPRKVAEQTIETPDWTQVAEDTSDSVMSIQVGTNGQVQGLGSGALYDDQGHVITNNHVVAPADTPGGEIAVTMKNGETTKAEIVGRDPSTDIAIIKLEQVPDGVKPLEVGDSKKLEVGDPVMALGNPLGLADSVTTGIVSALDRPVSTENIGEDASSQEKELTITNAIQTDAAINPGNSGGPLVDGNGRFIGVNSAAASLSQAGEGEQSGSIGIGFAIPANQAVMIADQLIANGKALHPFLGITLTDGHINNGGITRGTAKVQSVQAGSPAAKAGLKDGDDIVEVAGTKVNNAIALRALVRAQPVNTPVEITVVRGGQEQTLDVTLVLQ